MADVPALPRDKLNEFAKAIELKPGACYEVAFSAVVLLKKPLAEFYVLGKAVNSLDGKSTNHAWVKLFDGSYADPLLQSCDLLDTTTHFAFHELTCEQVLTLMKNHYGEQKFGEFRVCKLSLYPPESYGSDIFCREL